MSFSYPGMAGYLWGHDQNDVNGNPAGGDAHGKGFDIRWQDGPLGREEDGTRQEANGAFVEDVLEMVIHRMKYYQGENGDSDGRFKCRENALAITHLQEAAHWLEARTKDRERRGVEGVHVV